MNRMNLIKDFVGLLFPEVCHICGNSLFKNEMTVCSRCFLHLPETHFHNDPDNPVARVFWGRVPLQAATAMHYYRKGGSAQQLIHKLKYKGYQDIGIFLGNLLGTILKDHETFGSIESIVPVPLHKKKIKLRGFNQSECIARGIQEVMKTEIDTFSVSRSISSETQTKKSRYTRWENVSEIFVLNPDHQLANKHILVLDDVITTGSTMEACLNTLIGVEGIKLSVAAVAFSHK